MIVDPLTRHQIAWRAAQDLLEGTYVNLGLGMPLLVANYTPADRELMFHSENGIVGVGIFFVPAAVAASHQAGRASTSTGSAAARTRAIRPGGGLRADSARSVLTGRP